MASGVYVDWLGDVLAGTISSDFDAAGRFKLALYDDTITPDFFALGAIYGAGQFAAGEVPNGGGYTTGGQTMTGVALTVAGGLLQIAVDDVVWAASTIPGARYALMYDTTNTRAVYLIDFGTTRSTAAADFPVRFADGLILTHTP